MESISRRLNYDFKAARQRIMELTMMYRQGRRLNEHDPEWGWDLVAQIEEIEREISEAHRSPFSDYQERGYLNVTKLFSEAR